MISWQLKNRDRRWVQWPSSTTQAAGKHLRQHFDGVLPVGQQVLMCVVLAADPAFVAIGPRPLPSTGASSRATPRRRFKCCRPVIGQLSFCTEVASLLASRNELFHSSRLWTLLGRRWSLVTGNFFTTRSSCPCSFDFRAVTNNRFGKNRHKKT